MADDIPEWALTKARHLRNEELIANPSLCPMDWAFARYIAAHEEPPVDPLLIEARRIAYNVRRGIATDSASMNGRTAALILQGGWDDHQLVEASFAALRRGMELARAEP